MKRKIALIMLANATILLGGCAGLKQEFDGYPADTAILIDDVAYQINTTKCATIKGIDGINGALDCYDADGRQTASVAPVPDWRRNLVKDRFGMEWASPEHQAFLFNFFHEGGKEKAAQSISNSMQESIGILVKTKNLIDTTQKSYSIQIQEAQLRTQGFVAYASGGMPAWQVHRANTVQWRLDNARFFTNQMNK